MVGVLLAGTLLAVLNQMSGTVRLLRNSSLPQMVFISTSGWVRSVTV